MIDHNAKTCDYCGTSLPEMATLGPVTICSDPPILFWNGTPVAGFSPYEIKVLYMLVRQSGKASIGGLCNMGGTEYTSDETTRVRITHIRNKLRAHKIELFIHAVKGWGYVITIGKETIEDRYAAFLNGAPVRRMTENVRSYSGEVAVAYRQRRGRVFDVGKGVTSERLAK